MTRLAKENALDRFCDQESIRPLYQPFRRKNLTQGAYPSCYDREFVRERFQHHERLSLIRVATRKEKTVATFKDGVDLVGVTLAVVRHRRITGGQTCDPISELSRANWPNKIEADFCVPTPENLVRV
ncbi:hypothetical protein GCM10023199_34390 [Actinomycetospora chibensis]